jgi:hypothetical protein
VTSRYVPLRDVRRITHPVGQGSQPLGVCPDCGSDVYKATIRGVFSFACKDDPTMHHGPWESRVKLI